MRAEQRVRSKVEAWERRLYLPAYRYAEAAHLAQTSPQTISRWQGSYAVLGRRVQSAPAA